MRTSLLLAAAAGGLALACAAAPALAAAPVLLHSYDFSSTTNSAGSDYVVDLVGGQNGLLQGGATVSGGALSLDGVDDAVQFAAMLIPFADDFSVFIRAQIPAQTQRYYTEIISQGSSGGPGFYIGGAGNGYRLGDAYYLPGLAYSVDTAFHNLLLTNSAAGGLRFSIDDDEVFAGGHVNFGGGCNTRLGDQFCGAYNEYFQGKLDTVKIYSGVATYADAVGGGSDAPEPAAWMLMILGFVGAGLILRRRGPGGRLAEAAA
jgi:hypothetical protein